MDKLRSLYRQTQRNADTDFERVTLERMKKIHALTEKELNEIVSKQEDFSNLDEVNFYREKFKALINLFQESIHQGYKKSRVQTEAKAILQDNFVMQGSKLREDIKEEPIEKKSQISNKLLAEPEPKSAITSFFDTKKSEIQKSKIGFKSILEGLPQATRKYQVRKLQGGERNSGEMLRLQQQIDRLRSDMRKQGEEKEFKTGLYELKTKELQDKINFLERDMINLQQENKKLKEESHKSEADSKGYEPNPFFPQVNHVDLYEGEGEYDPYRIRYHNNDMGRIKDKGFKKENLSHRFAPIAEEDENRHKDRKNSNNLDILKQLDNSQSQKSFAKSSRLHFDKEQVEDELRNVAVRSKMSFFKSSVVIYRGEQCQIAIRSLELINHERRKMVIYVNNKRKHDTMFSIAYKCDKNYYEMAFNKKIGLIDGERQGREEIQVKLVNKLDLDSVIEATLTFNSKQINFLVPAMFLEFVDKRPPPEQPDRYQKYRVKTIYQFSSIETAGELLAMEMHYGNGVGCNTGRVYAVSKHHEGYIWLHWHSVGVVEVQTIHPWKLFLSYLLCKDS